MRHRIDYYVVIDTNVLVSAMLRWNSVPGNIMELFHLDQAIIDDVIEGVTERAIFVDAEAVDAELPAPKDRVFYEVVMEKRKREDAYLVTGNFKSCSREVKGGISCPGIKTCQTALDNPSRFVFVVALIA